MNRPARLCVMISGGGRTLLNLQDRIDDASLLASITLVIASGPCEGVARARSRGLHVEVIPGVIPAIELGRLLTSHAIDLVVLAGYLKLVRIPPGYEGRVINIHPALLPGFGGPGMYGDRVHAAVLKAGEPTSGCTVHLCDEAFDTGKVLLQRTCEVLPGDTPQTLATRVFELEKEAYPRAIADYLRTLDP